MMKEITNVDSVPSAGTDVDSSNLVETYSVSQNGTKPNVGSSGLHITEQRFRDFFSVFGNCADRYENGKKVVIYTLNRNIDNKFNLSYHLKFPQKNVQFNFWLDKISYLNSKESVTVSFFNGNETQEKYRLKNILKTDSLIELQTKVYELFNEYK